MTNPYSGPYGSKLKEGQTCPKCGGEKLIKRTTKKKHKVRADPKFGFHYYLYCPECHRMFIVEAAKYLLSPSEKRGLFDEKSG